MVWVRAVVKMLLRALARGPRVSAAGVGGAGEGERSWGAVAIAFLGSNWYKCESAKSIGDDVRFHVR